MWIYALHIAFWAVFVARSFLARSGSGAPAKSHPGAGRLVALHMLGLGILYFGLGQALHDGVAGVVPTLSGLGAAVMVSGIALSIWSVKVFRSWKLRAELAADHELCTTGPFGYVRHPIYLAIALLGLGTAVAAPSVLTAIGAVAVATSGHVRALGEEKLLSEVFGDRYREYMARTGRWIPTLR